MAAAASDDREYGKLYPVARAILRPVFRTGWRTYLRGIENLPADGPAIVCPNHTSVIDSFLLPSALPRRITFVGKAEYLDDWKTKHLFPALGMIPIDRAGGDASSRALDAAAGVLQRGELFGIYPEGTRSRDGKLHKGHTGVARLALEMRVPVIPAAMVGTFEAKPKGGKTRYFSKTAAVIGEPMDFSRYWGKQDDKEVCRRVTDEVMHAIAKLSGQEYVDEYQHNPAVPTHAKVPAPSAPAKAK